MAGHAFPLTLPLDNSLNRRWWAGWQEGAVFSDEERFVGPVLVIELLSEDEMAVVSDFLGLLLRNPLRAAAAPEASGKPQWSLEDDIAAVVGRATDKGATYEEIAGGLYKAIAELTFAVAVKDWARAMGLGAPEGRVLPAHGENRETPEPGLPSDIPPRHPATSIGE